MPQNNPRRGYTLFAGLLFWIALSYLTAWIGAQVSPGIAPGEWYESIAKPSWNPPGWLFGPVWTALYTMMGVAVWLVWKDYGFSGAKKAITLFLIQLILNGLWSQIFFGMQEIGWAFLEILILLFAIAITTILFFEKNKLAGWLMVPYLLWVSFASVLNGTLWWLN
ncbi:MAG: tryptophan-rich sensory protein [Balneolaceae bacterium]|nr:MAG: tryptophan-rich sensory protein [Balneolaceae bacterium]